MARKNRVQPTENQQLFRKLKKQLKQKARRAEARGYVFAEGFTDFEMPNRVTKKALEKLQNLIKNIYNYALSYDPLKGEVISGTEKRKQERSTAARKAAETRRRNREPVDKFWTDESGETWYNDYSEEYVESLRYESQTILQNLLQDIEQWEPDPKWSSELQSIKEDDVNKLKSIIYGRINEVGIQEVAATIKQNSAELIRLAHEVMYQSGNKFKMSGREGIRINMNRIASLLIGRPLSVLEAMQIEQSNIALTEYE